MIYHSIFNFNSLKTNSISSNANDCNYTFLKFVQRKKNVILFMLTFSVSALDFPIKAPSTLRKINGKHSQKC